MAPQMPKPAPRAMTRVWRTPTAELKNSINVFAGILGIDCFLISRNSRSRNENCNAAPIPASPFNYLISMIHSDPASEDVSYIIFVYEKPPLLRRRACALRLGLRRIPRRPHLLSEPALWIDIFQYQRRFEGSRPKDICSWGV